MEDKAGYPVMMPSNQVSFWAKLTGEIRTAERSSFAVWMPNVLKHFLQDKGDNYTRRYCKDKKKRN